MSSIVSKYRMCSLLQSYSPLIVQKRFNTRESIHRYREPDKFKKHMLAASEPYHRRTYVLPQDSCTGYQPKFHDMEPLDSIYAQELLSAIKSNDFVLFVQHNYTPFQSERVYKNNIIKSGGLFYSHKNIVYKSVFSDLGVSQVENLFISRNSLVLGKLESLPKCVGVFRSMPQFILLAGYIENQVYSYDDLQIFSNNPDLDTNRATLTCILDRPAIDLYQNLQKYVEINDGVDQANTQGAVETDDDSSNTKSDQ